MNTPLLFGHAAEEYDAVVAQLNAELLTGSVTRDDENVY